MFPLPLPTLRILCITASGLLPLLVPAFLVASPHPASHPASAPATGPAQAGDHCLLVTQASDLEGLRAAVRLLEDRGARLPHLFPPSSALGRIPADLDPADLAGPAVAWSCDPAVPGGVAEQAGPALAGVWHQLHRPDGPPASPPPASFGPDLLPRPFEEAPVEPRAPGDCWVSGGSSLYLAGDIALGIVMPESSPDSPDTETWQPERQDRVVAEIVQAGTVLAEQVLPWAGLDFVYEVHRSVPLDREPIEMPSSSAPLWAREALAVLGYPSSSAYVRALREAHGTDWAVAVFVADDLNDPDNRFADGQRFAFAYLGGPSLWMTYDNDGWGIDRMDTVFAHELGHSFDALDEYSSAQPRCDSTSGVLSVENRNADATGGCPSEEPCIMRATSMTSGAEGSDPAAPLLTGYCAWSLGQMGAWDRDGDTLSDIRDVPPQSFLDEVVPHPVETADLTLTGEARALPNVLEAGDTSITYHTLNRVSRVEYRLDGGAWTEAEGLWDQVCLDFQIALTDLDEGWHTVESRAVSVLCEPDDPEICDPPRERIEESLAVRDFYVNTDCPDDGLEQNDRPGEAVAVPAGRLDGLQICAFDTDRYRVYLREGAAAEFRLEWQEPAVRMELVLLGPRGLEQGRDSAGGGSLAVALPAAPATGHYELVVSAGPEEETGYALEVLAECIDDAHEPNDDPAAAAHLAPGEHRDLQLCDGDEDWYLVSLGDGANLDAEIAFSHAVGDLDLALFDSEAVLLDESATLSDTEAVGVGPVTGGRYYLRVRGADPAVDNRYDLTLGLDGCRDDPYENNDLQGEAALLAEGRTSELRLCPSESDWYRVRLEHPSFLRVRALFDNDAGNLDLEVRDGGGDLIAGSWSSEDGERVDLERLAQGDYLVHVQGRNGAPSPRYDLELLQAPPVLLNVTKRDQEDVLLAWTDAGVDCYEGARSNRADDFAGAQRFSTGLGDADQEEAGEGNRRHDDLAAIDGTRLYFYDVVPSVCGGGDLQLTKQVAPYPVYPPDGNLSERPEFLLKLTNPGREPVTDIVLRDEMPLPVSEFTVLEIPAGATDRSQPTGGQFGRGFVEVEIPTLAGGETAAVRVMWFADPFGTPNQKSAVLRNQARATGFDAAGGRDLVVLSDDPSTLAFPDSTDVALPPLDTTGGTSLLVRTFWNQDVDIALRVEDPCGNLLGTEDLGSAPCSGVDAWVSQAGGCGDPWPWGWAEAVEWSTAAEPPAGTYRVSLRLMEDRTDGGTCLHAAPEDAVVLADLPDGGQEWRWLVLDPSERDWQEVLTFTLP